MRVRIRVVFPQPAAPVRVLTSPLELGALDEGVERDLLVWRQGDVWGRGGVSCLEEA
jgi:hypothetical protein